MNKLISLLMKNYIKCVFWFLLLCVFWIMTNKFSFHLCWKTNGLQCVCSEHKTPTEKLYVYHKIEI